MTPPIDFITFLEVFQTEYAGSIPATRSRPPVRTISGSKHRAASRAALLHCADVCAALAVERGRNLMLLRHLAVRRQLVDDAGQGRGQLLEQFLLVHPRPLRDLVNELRPECGAEIIGVDRLVLPGADPGVGDIAVAGIPELVEQAAQSAE